MGELFTVKKKTVTNVGEDEESTTVEISDTALNLINRYIQVLEKQEDRQKIAEDRYWALEKERAEDGAKETQGTLKCQIPQD